MRTQDDAATTQGERVRAPARPRRAFLILNAKASRTGSLPVKLALDMLRDGGITLEELPCRGGGATYEEILARRDEVDCVIVGGGDGTMNSMGRALTETGLTLGILPLGTANDLAKTLGIGPDLESAARLILAGEVREIDLGQVNGNPFFNVASIGFSAELARELTAEAKKRWGTLGYALAGAKLLFRTRPFTAFIEHDGINERVKTVQISVGNGRHYGGGLTVDEMAEPDDGKLHVYSLEVGHWTRLLALAPALKRGTHGAQNDVRVFDTNEVTIRTRKTRSVNTDGELTTATPATFRVIPRAVRVYAKSREKKAVA